MKPKTQYVVIRNAYDMTGKTTNVNYYVGKLNVFDDGEVGDVVILGHTGCHDGCRIPTCTLVEKANAENLSEGAVKTAIGEYVLSQYNSASAKPKAKPVERPYRPLQVEEPVQVAKPKSQHRSLNLLDGVVESINKEVA